MNNELKILCPFCNVVWTADMEDDLWASAGCSTCGDASITGEFNIDCSNCKKIVYVKEYVLIVE
jgi:hypothetical protein